MKRALLNVFVWLLCLDSVAFAASLLQDCSGVSITSPRPSGDPVRGRVSVTGSANIPNFQFYKVEFAPGAVPQDAAFRNLASDVHRSPVPSGQLEIFDTTRVSDGSYSLRLTVVDNRGNFPCPPVTVGPIIVFNRAPLDTPTPEPTATDTPTPQPSVSPSPAPSGAATR
ncbi:MAG: hypothetical protein LC737_05925, partial [Chloroflexi bacterium]|nr:hypothetical protein [Chloroflexota bacterium]